MKMKILDATPEKRVFLSIISEYDLKRAICELIDNAIDLWSKKKRTDLKIKIITDDRQQTISIEDNAGGIEESKLDHIVSPGKTSNDVSDNVIGYFGVGSKRAVVALAENIEIHSRYENEKTFMVKLDEHWIAEDPSWQLPYSLSKKEINPYTTLIELSKLRIHLTKDEIEGLRNHLSEVYSRYIDRGIYIKVNGKKIEAINFDDQWSYPKGLFPVQFVAQIPIEDRAVEVDVLSGLIDHPGDPDSSYGVFMYCNDRLITRGLTDFNVGFSSGMVGNPHYNISLVRTIVMIKGQSRDMPWDSSKSGINSKHPIFQAIRQSIIDATKRYAQVSRSLQGKWETEVFPYKTGHILTEKLATLTSIPKNYLPTPPVSKKKWHQKILESNRKIVSKKPWVVGLIDSVIALDTVYKLPLRQKNRICLIILDSTVEIAYKEYLVNEKSIGNQKFKDICENRTDVEKEVLKHITIDTETIKQINFYYKIRCDLIHQRATPDISDEQIEGYRTILEKLLQDMFNLKF